MKPRRPWTVTPHSAVQQLDDNLWVVESRVPGIPWPRRMCVVRRSDGALLFFHAIPLDDATLAQVCAFGEPKYLVVSYASHGIDADAFQKRLNLKLYGPRVNEKALRERFDLDGFLEDIPKDPSVEVFSMPGVKSGEAAMRVLSAGGATLAFSDAVMNMKTGGLPMRLLGLLGGPKSPRAYRWIAVKDKKAFKAKLEELAATPRLARILPCHGDVVLEGAAGAMAQIAASM